MIDIFTSFLPSLNPLILPVKWRDRLPSHFVEVWGTNAFYISLIPDSFPYLEQQKTRQMIMLRVLVNVRTWNKAGSLDPGAEDTQRVCFLRRGPWLKSEPWKEEEEGFLCREVGGQGSQATCVCLCSCFSGTIEKQRSDPVYQDFDFFKPEWLFPAQIEHMFAQLCALWGISSFGKSQASGAPRTQPPWTAWPSPREPRGPSPGPHERRGPDPVNSADGPREQCSPAPTNSAARPP